MKNFKKTLLTFLFIGIINNAAAVQIGLNDTGEVLIFPYYTVNNNLNTLYSIVNPTQHAKAIKITFLEGENSREVLSFNVYLSKFDVWTGALAPHLVNSNNTGGADIDSAHDGEPTAIHLTTDRSCTPFLIKSGQQFLPFMIDLDTPNNNMYRAREGHIEIIEMGVITGDAELAVAHAGDNGPSNCGMIQSAWANDNEWDLDPLLDPTGGLFGSASLVNVAEGVTFSYNAIALENFWQGAGIHTTPGSLIPNLSDAHPQSKILHHNGELLISEWSSGFEAVSAVLMKAEVFNEYAYDSIINGQSEWVVTLPTKRFHTNVEGTAIAPFTNIWDGIEACDEFIMGMWDRETLNYNRCPSCGLPGFLPPPQPEFCHSANVFEFISASAETDITSKIFGSGNNISILISPNNFYSSSPTENGWATMNFNDEETNTMVPNSGVGFLGLPAIGFMVQQFANANAQPGLLAQYGALFSHKGRIVTLESTAVKNLKP